MCAVVLTPEAAKLAGAFPKTVRVRLVGTVERLTHWP
jgi:hypothetical protein